MDPRSHYAAHFESLLKRNGSPAWLRSLRSGALERFHELGFPTLKDEDWKYTSVAPIAEVAFEPGGPEGHELAARGELDRWTASHAEELRGRLLVFVNGRFSQQLSSFSETVEGVRAGNLAAILAGEPSLVEGRLGGADVFARHPFAALNTALAEDGLFLCLPDRAVLERPVLVVHIAVPDATPRAFHPRSLIVAGAGSQATVVEAYLGSHCARYFTNAVTEVLLGPEAGVELYRLEREGRQAFHVSNTRVTQAQGSRFTSHSVVMGGALVRNDLSALLGEEGTECTLNGLYLARDRQHVDNHTAVDHAKPRCRSTEVYKGVLDGGARGVFNGKVLVRQDAQKTDARQSNKNLLLSEDAIVDTKPELEIYADDVKCSHGAAVGQLDEDALFYLRARGLPLAAARSMLTYAFASEVLEAMGLAPVRLELEGQLHGWLGGRA